MASTLALTKLLVSIVFLPGLTLFSDKRLLTGPTSSSVQENNYGTEPTSKKIIQPPLKLNVSAEHKDFYVNLPNRKIISNKPSAVGVADESILISNRSVIERTSYQANQSTFGKTGLETLGVPKENFTLRGHLENLDESLVDMVSEVKYHIQQVSIIGAEKDTVGAVLQMNIVQAKNAVLNQEYKLQEDLKRAERQQEKEFEKIETQVEVLDTETNTNEARILQLQRRIKELEGLVGLPVRKFAE